MPNEIFTMKEVPLKKLYKRIDGKNHVVDIEEGCLFERIRVQLGEEETVVYNHKEEKAFPLGRDGMVYVLEKDLGYNPVFNYTNLWHFEEMVIRGSVH